MTRVATRSRLATALVAMTAWVISMGLIAPGATAAGADTLEFLYKDKFESGNYNGNAGSHNFRGPWFEYGDWGGAGKGSVAVETGSACQNGRCARISGDNEDVSGRGLARWADLEGAATARIKLKHRQDVDEGEGGVKVVVYDGRAWQTLFEIAFDNEDENGHTETIPVAQFAGPDFAIGFFAYGNLDGDVYIDDVAVFGAWDAPVTTTTAAATTTTAPTTTTTTVPVTTTTVAPTTTAVPTTTLAPTTTLGPTVSAPPTTTTVAPVTTQPPTTAPPLEDDQRYTQKAELASHLILANSMMELPTAIDQIPTPSPVTQIMASITTTAVTVRSHLLSALALGLMIAITAVWGLGRREATISPVGEPSSRSPGES